MIVKKLAKNGEQLCQSEITAVIDTTLKQPQVFWMEKNLMHGLDAYKIWGKVGEEMHSGIPC